MQSAETLANLQKFLQLLNPSQSRVEILTQVARQLVEMFGVDHSGVMLFGAADIEGVVIAEYPPQGVVGLRASLLDYPLVDQLKAERKPIAVFEAQEDPIAGQMRNVFRELGIQSIAIIPLVVKDKLIGGLGLDVTRGKRVFTPAELELGAVIGTQIAVAIDYLEALEAAETSRRQAQTLHEVNRLLSESLDLDEVLPLILEQSEKVIPIDGSSIYLLVEGGIQIRAWRGIYSPFAEQEIIPLDDLWGIAEVVKTKAPVLVADTGQNPSWKVDESSPIRSWLGLPLIARGEVVGVLNMDGYQPHQFNETHLALARPFARQAGLAIANARLYGEAKNWASLLTSVQAIGLSMVASLELNEVLETVTSSVLQLLEAHEVRIFLYDLGQDQFTMVAALDENHKFNEVDLNPRSPRQNGLTISVVRSGQPLAVSDTYSHPLFQERADQLGFRAIIGVPLKKRHEVLGVLTVSYAQTHHFLQDEFNLLNLLANQAAVALENARLYNQEQLQLQAEAKRSEQWRRVQELTSTLNASLDMDRVLHHACEQLVKLLEVDHCGILLSDEGATSGRVVAEYPGQGLEGSLISLDYPAFQQMLQDLQPFAITNVAEDKTLGEVQLNLNRLGIRSILIAPLIVQGRVIGSVGLDSIRQARQFTADELNMIRIVAGQIAIATTNARTYQAERAARIQADTLREVAAVLNETLDLNEVFERILVQTSRVITCDSSSIILRDRNRFKVVAARGFPNLQDIIGLTFDFSDQAPYQKIARTRRPVVVGDILEVAGWQHTSPTPIRSWIGAPLLASDRLIGLLTIDHSQPNFYTQADGELVMAFANLAAIALENARLYEVEVKQIERELSIAREIQQGFLPHYIPEIPGWSIAAICLPARETGGDFYEFVERLDGKWGVAVGDVSGKSIPAAMLMAAAQSTVRAKGSDHLSPAKVISETNQLLCDDVPRGSFVAMSYGLLAPHDPTVHLSNAGQLAPFVVPASGAPIRLLETPDPHWPLGIIPDSPYQEISVELNPGDLLVFYTDGLVERKNEKEELFGFEGVISTLEKTRGQPAEQVLQALLEAADCFAGGLPAHDDVTLVVIRRTSASI